VESGLGRYSESVPKQTKKRKSTCLARQLRSVDLSIAGRGELIQINGPEIQRTKLDNINEVLSEVVSQHSSAVDLPRLISEE
jgi:hypothetical protein